MPDITSQALPASRPVERTQEDPFPVVRTSAWVAAVFCLLVSAALIFEHFRSRPLDMLRAEGVQALKEKLGSAPADEQLKNRVRDEDLALRKRFFHKLSMTRSGSWLLLGGGLIFLLAAKRAARYRAQLPLPQPKADAATEAARMAARMRRSVAVAGLALGVGFLGVAFSVRTHLPARLSDFEKLAGGGVSAAAAAVVEGPSPAEMQRNWPQFRGPLGTGLSTQTNVPLTWDLKTGAGLAWKAAVPAPGFNSPVVWGNRVFLSGGDKKKREVLCFSAETGELLWDRPVENVAGSPAEVPEIPAQTGYAAATMATDGQRVYAIFASGELAAVGFDGKLAWAKSLGVLKNQYGHASSLIAWHGKVLLQLDQGDSENRKSKLYAFDGATGQVLWERPRPVPSSWASPIVIDAGGKQQIITLAIPWVISHAATDGTELWRVECLAGEVTPSPSFSAGLVFVASPSDKLLAIRPDGQGDVTKTHVAWSAEDNVPDVTSPVSNDELVFTVTTLGILTCFDAKTGKKQWEHDFGTDFQASPALVGNRVYLIGLKGGAVVVEASRQFKQLARTDLETDEKFLASPAFVQNRIFIRGTKNLYCIGAKDEKVAKGSEGK